MFLRVGLKAKNNVLDRMQNLFCGLKGIKMADLASLMLYSFFLVPLFYVMRDVSDMSAFDDIRLETESFKFQTIYK